MAIDDITERYKCGIHVIAADVGDESAVAELLERIRAELPPLAGVVHLAGVLDDSERRWCPRRSAAATWTV